MFPRRRRREGGGGLCQMTDTHRHTHIHEHTKHARSHDHECNWTHAPQAAHYLGVLCAQHELPALLRSREIIGLKVLHVKHVALFLLQAEPQPANNRWGGSHNTITAENCKTPRWCSQFPTTNAHPGANAACILPFKCVEEGLHQTPRLLRRASKDGIELLLPLKGTPSS